MTNKILDGLELAKIQTTDRNGDELGPSSRLIFERTIRHDVATEGQGRGLAASHSGAAQGLGGAMGAEAALQLGVAPLSPAASPMDSPMSAPSTLVAGDIAIVGYNTRTGSDVNGPDSFSFLLTRDIGSGTQIFFSDRAWNGASFVNASGDGTYTYTAGADLAAGTVITIAQAALTGVGINLDGAGDTLYAYQGGADAPARFLHALDMADGNATFNGSLANTGLSGTLFTAAVGANNANWAGRDYNAQPTQVHTSIHDATDWVQNENSTQGALTGPLATAPDRQIWVGGSGGGEALVRINTDESVSSGDVGFAVSHLFQNDANLFHPSDITFDAVHDKFFFIDLDVAGHNRVVQGSISQMMANPGGALSFTILYADDTIAAPNASHSMRTLSIDPDHGIVYFDHGTTFNKVSYDTANQTPTVLANLGTDNYVTQATIDYASGEVYLGSSRIIAVFGTDLIEKNYIYRATGLTSSSTTLSFGQLPFSPDDDDPGAPNNPNIPPLPGEAWPQERGTIRGVDIDPVNHVLYFTTGSVSLDVSAAQDGSQMQSFLGGVWKYNLVGNPTGTVTNVFQQDGVNGPPGLLYYIEVDPSTGQYYVTDETGTNALVDDGGVWVGSTSGGAPTLVSHVGNINGLGPQGLELQTAPTLSITNVASPTAIETAGADSGFSTPIQMISAATTSDVDTTGQTDQMAGAQVRITANFQTGASHLDRLTINGATSGTIELGAKDISFSYDSTLGIMTLSGPQTFANYQAALALVSYSVSGDNPTNYGTATTRTIAWSAFDGLLYSDEQTTTVQVPGTNDAPVNVVGATSTLLEDAAPVTLSGVSISDPDADPATQDMQVTLHVSHGTLNLATNVSGGVGAGDVTGNGTDTIVVTGTQNEINSTLAAATGLQYDSAANYYGSDGLEITTSDLGANGTGGAATDTDTKSISITAVNDAPTGTAEDRTINEDQAYVFTLADFTDGFGDATDSPSPNSLNRVQVFSLASDGVLMYDADGGGAGLAVAVNLLQFISAADITAGKLFFVPTANEFDTTDYSTFDFKLEDDGGTSNGGVNLSAAYAFTFDVNPVNDAPAGSDNTVSVLEDGAYTFAAADFGYSDPVEGDALLAVKITTIPGAGSLELNGVAVTAGDFVSVSDITAGLLTFTPVAGANGTGYASLTFQVQDNGGTSNGGVDLDQSANTLTVDVTSVNDAPAGADKTVTTNEDTTYTFAAADFGFSDGSDGNTLAAVIISALPGPGSLELNGVAVTAGQSISVADITGGLLTYTPAADANGDAYASLSFQVQDDGGTSNGGVDLDPSPNFITIDVNPVNDAPAVANAIPDQIGYFDEAFSFTFASNAFDDIEGDTLSYSAQLNGGGALPSWLNFNATTREFSGTPALGDVGTLSVDVIADDGHGGTVTDTFDIEVTGDLTLLGRFVADTLAGHHGDDFVSGRGGNDSLTGSFGKDRLIGGAGADTLEGGNGGDKLLGGIGDDVLVGGLGRDTYRGGSGHDTFVYGEGDIPGGAPPREGIRDFVHGDDVIDLAGIDANGADAGDGTFSFLGDGHFTGAGAEVRYHAAGTALILEFDIDGDKVVDFELGVRGESTLVAGDFVL